LAAIEEGSCYGGHEKNDMKMGMLFRQPERLAHRVFSSPGFLVGSLWKDRERSKLLTCGNPTRPVYTHYKQVAPKSVKQYCQGLGLYQDMVVEAATALLISPTKRGWFIIRQKSGNTFSAP
jgi:hypothetical protein